MYENQFLTTENPCVPGSPEVSGLEAPLSKAISKEVAFFNQFISFKVWESLQLIPWYKQFLDGHKSHRHRPIPSVFHVASPIIDRS